MEIDEIIKELEEIKEDKETIFYKIADLYDKIEEWEAEKEYILDELANIQQYAK